MDFVPEVRVGVEGPSDVAMARALVESVGFRAVVYEPFEGSGKLDKRIRQMSQARPPVPWIFFRDADSSCPVALREDLLGGREHDAVIELRVPVTMTEAWLLADQAGFARHFHVPVGRIPTEPDTCLHAKRALLTACQSSTSARTRKDMVRGGPRVGPRYVSRLNEFAATVWDIERARQSSPSLDRTVRRLTWMYEQACRQAEEGYGVRSA